MRSVEQKLVDICFQVAIVSARCNQGKSTEEIAAWVVDQLRFMGFETKPCGASWGVLVSQVENETDRF